MDRRERERARALAFQQCPGCGHDFATTEGETSCHYYECPYLPEALDVRCPKCLYNFYTGEGAAECGDPPTCDFALETAPFRVATMGQWLARQPR